METHMSKFAMPRLSAYLVCRDAAKAIDFYAAALGGQVLARLDGPDGKLFHATLGVNDGAVVMVAEERPQWGALSPASFNGTAVTLHLDVKDCDAALKRATDAGVRVVMPAEDMFWGDRYALVEDPFGHRWSFGQKLRDVSPAEMEATAREMFKQAAGCAGAGKEA